MIGSTSPSFAGSERQRSVRAHAGVHVTASNARSTRSAARYVKGDAEVEEEFGPHRIPRYRIRPAPRSAVLQPYDLTHYVLPQSRVVPQTRERLPPSQPYNAREVGNLRS